MARRAWSTLLSRTRTCTGASLHQRTRCTGRRRHHTGIKSSTPRRGCEGVPGDEPSDRRLYPAAAAPHIGVMALLKIAHMGHPVLRDRARAVDDPTAPWVRRLFEDMIETMEDAGGTGLAAPQVHMPWRIVVFRVGGERLTDLPGDSEQDLTALINPVIEPVGNELAYGWEGCLSVRGLRGVVPRHLRVPYRGFGLGGEALERDVAGFHAPIV